jgi:sugar phosphate isomerase/epimerase
MRRFALTSWSLHFSLTDGTLTLLELPARMRDAGISTLEICHFHIPATDAGFIGALRRALAQAEVELFSILIDTGNIATADASCQAADMRTIKGWIDVASRLGASAVRVVAGEEPPDDEAALVRSAAALRQLAAYANERNVRVLTENFRPLLSTAANCNRLLDELDGAVGLCADIGNFPASVRHAEFSAIVGRASVVHVKATYDAAGNIEASTLHACLDASVQAGFAGPYTLVYDRDGHVWPRLGELRQIVGQYI